MKGTRKKVRKLTEDERYLVKLRSVFKKGAYEERMLLKEFIDLSYRITFRLPKKRKHQQAGKIISLDDYRRAGVRS